ncbi:hypothetical protein F2Q70_00026578 [Brassica cretica]|uniref:Uncharacterized protein n=1 Tax=Brassica cretica TaxID=69181 RepID=A0A8S9LJ39_BRACR|nr:hypothetical protein F2Q70_00026578 [Brassica cretica]
MVIRESFHYVEADVENLKLNLLLKNMRMRFQKKKDVAYKLKKKHVEGMKLWPMLNRPCYYPLQELKLELQAKVYILTTYACAMPPRSGVALDERCTSRNKRGRKQCNLVIFTKNSRAEQPEVPVPAAEIFKEVSKYFGILPRTYPPCYYPLQELKLELQAKVYILTTYACAMPPR